MSKWFKQDLAERDQMAARESFEAYKELVTRFPQSMYAEDASLRMRHIINLLAKSEIKVAYYYFKKGAYVAAINRAQTTLNDYQNIAAVEDALIILVESYKALGLTQLDIAGVSNSGNRFIVELEAGKPTVQFQKTLDTLNLLGLEMVIREKTSGDL
jgi:outer membrane assembly lipoprotein YfiO